MPSSATVDVDDFVDKAPFGPFHVKVLLICTIMMMIDGYDLYLVGWVLPSLSEDYGVPRTALTPVLLIQQLGMLVGGYVIAPLADRIGRRTLLLIACAIIAVSSFVTLLATDVVGFAACRFVTGMFASAVVPNLLSMTSEVAPKRLRATMSTIVLCGAMGGALIGAVMQAFVLEPYGWRGAFWIGALLPLLMLPVIWFALPESLKFLMAKAPSDRRIAQMTTALTPKGSVVPVLSLKPRLDVAGGRRIRDIFGAGQAPRSLLLWGAFLCSFMFIGMFSAWSTTVFRDIVGMPWNQVAWTTATYTACGIVGTLAVGVAIDRFGFRKILPTFFLVGCAGAVGLGLSGVGAPLFAFLALMALFQVGSQAGLAALAPTLYASESRATGVGWAYGAGRIGALCAPVAGAALIHGGFGADVIFILMAAPLFVAGILVFCLTTLDRRRAQAQVIAEASVHG